MIVTSVNIGSILITQYMTNICKTTFVLDIGQCHSLRDCQCWLNLTKIGKIKLDHTIGKYYVKSMIKNREKLLCTYGLLRNKSKIHFSYESTAILSLASQ